MICPNCGANVSDNEKVCSNCGASNLEPNVGDKEIKSTGVLIASILELLLGPICFITGLIGLILTLSKLNPAIQNGNWAEAKKVKKKIKKVLWTGFILSILLLLIILMLIAITLPMISQTRPDDPAVREDKLNAIKISIATDWWYMNAKNEGLEYENVEKGFVRVDKVDGLEDYINLSSYQVSSYLNNTSEGMYYVTIIDETWRPRVVVAIGPKDLGNAPVKDRSVERVFYGDVENSAALEAKPYTGNGSGIAYIEP